MLLLTAYTVYMNTQPNIDQVYIKGFHLDRYTPSSTLLQIITTIIVNRAT